MQINYLLTDGQQIISVISYETS